MGAAARERPSPSSRAPPAGTPRTGCSRRSRCRRSSGSSSLAWLSARRLLPAARRVARPLRPGGAADRPATSTSRRRRSRSRRPALLCARRPSAASRRRTGELRRLRHADEAARDVAAPADGRRGRVRRRLRRPGAGTSSRRRWSASRSPAAAPATLNHYLDRDIDKLMGERTAGRPGRRRAAWRRSGRSSTGSRSRRSRSSCSTRSSTCRRRCSRWPGTSSTSSSTRAGSSARRRRTSSSAARRARCRRSSATRRATGHLGWAALVMFAIVFLWTPPHFWALALMIRSTTRTPTCRCCPSCAATARRRGRSRGTRSRSSRRRCVPVAFGVFGLVYGVAALVLGALLSLLAFAALARDDAAARREAVPLLDALPRPALRRDGPRRGRLMSEPPSPIRRAAPARARLPCAGRHVRGDRADTRARAQEHPAWRSSLVVLFLALFGGHVPRSACSTTPSPVTREPRAHRRHLHHRARRARARDPARGQGSLRHGRCPHDVRLGGLRRTTCRPRRRRRCGCSRRPATRTSARRTCTSSPTASPRRTSTTARSRTRPRPGVSRAARAAARRRRSRPGSRTPRSAPTPAARSGFRPRAAGSPASSRPTGSCRSDGVFPLAPSFDHAGPMARDVAGCVEMMEVLVPGFAAAEPALADLRVAVAWFERADPLVRRARRRGGRARSRRVAPVELPLRGRHLRRSSCARSRDVHREL